MPGRRGRQNVSSNIREFTKGKTFRRTARKFGRRRALRQAVAVGYAMAGVGRRRRRKRR